MKILIYTMTGFCFLPAGVAFLQSVLSTHAGCINGFESTVIPSVGSGVGDPIGTIFGALFQGLIRTIITIDGILNSWWAKFIVGLPILFFILMQREFNSTREWSVSTIR